MIVLFSLLFLFFFNDTTTTEIYTLSLHDALPISLCTHANAKADHVIAAYMQHSGVARRRPISWSRTARYLTSGGSVRSEEHTSELQSHSDLVCRLLLEKKKKMTRHGMLVVKRMKI